MKWEELTEQLVVTITIAFILVAMALSFRWAGSYSNRIRCNSWSIRSDGVLEAETDEGTLKFRHKDIEFIEPSYNNSHTTVSIGNLQRMVWIDFPDKNEALEFIALMERKLSRPDEID